MSTQGSYCNILNKEIYFEYLHPELRNTSRPLLIFLHEGLGSCRQWKNFPLLISEAVGCAALLYDRYGYGKSEALQEVRKMDYMETEAYCFLPELLKHLQITEPILLIGHSDGGSIALLFASRFQEQVLGVVSMADHLFIEDITLQGFRETKKSYESGSLRRLLYKFHGEKVDSMFYGWCDTWLAESAASWNIEPCLATLQTPVFNIQGKDDIYGSAAQMTSKIKNLQGSVQSLFLEHCGHEPHFQAAKIVFQQISNFIRVVSEI